MRTLAIIWRAADLLFATRADAVVEVLPPLACTAGPALPPWVRGLFSYRGNLTPLVDSRTLLGMPRAPDRMANRVLVVRTRLGEANTECHVGLWVDSVVEIERIDFEEPGHHPGFATDRGRFLGPVVQATGGQVQLVEPSEMFSPEQAAVISQRLAEAAA